MRVLEQALALSAYFPAGFVESWLSWLGGLRLQCNVVLGTRNWTAAIQPTPVACCHLLPSNRSLARDEQDIGGFLPKRTAFL